MQRILTLSNLLSEKIEQKASITELLQTVKMLESELLHLKKITPPPTDIEQPIAVLNIAKQLSEDNAADTLHAIEEAKTIEVLQVDEDELAAELEEIKKNAEQRNHLSFINRQPILIDEEEIPTLANRQTTFTPEETKASTTALNELLPTENAHSINEKFGAATKEEGDVFNEVGKKDLNELLTSENSHSINDKFVTPKKEVGDLFNDISKKELNETLSENEVSSLNDQIANLQDAPKTLTVHEINEMNKSIIEMGKIEIHPAETVAITFATKELNDALPTKSTSLNERLNNQQTQVSDSLMDTPIKDLKKAIGVNERFLYLNELFRGDETMYERSIKTINAFNVYPEAELWIRRELKLKLGWDEKYQTVKQFDQLIRRRFA